MLSLWGVTLARSLHSFYWEGPKEPMLDCAAYVKDAVLQAGCWQAEAARYAAKLALQGTHWGAFATGLAGSLAFFAGAFVLGAARWQAGYGRQEMRARMAAAFIGDISAWHTFLTDENVVGTLNAKVANHEVMYFHPGDSWLKVYFVDPGKSGLFPTTIARDLAYYYSRMSGEIGRLIWLHKLAKAGKQQESWVPREQTNCAASIVKLHIIGNELIKQLEAEQNDALKTRRSWFWLALKPG